MGNDNSMLVFLKNADEFKENVEKVIGLGFDRRKGTLSRRWKWFPRLVNRNGRWWGSFTRSAVGLRMISCSRFGGVLWLWSHPRRMSWEKWMCWWKRWMGGWQPADVKLELRMFCISVWRIGFCRGVVLLKFFCPRIWSRRNRIWLPCFCVCKEDVFEEVCDAISRTSSLASEYSWYEKELCWNGVRMREKCDSRTLL